MSRIVPDDDFRTAVDIRAEDRLVVVSVSGTLSVERLASLGPMIGEIRTLTADWGVIFDFSAASSEHIFRTDLEGLAADLRKPTAVPRFPVAYVVPSDLSFGLARMFAVLAGHAPVEGSRPRFVARTLDEAVLWMQKRFVD